MQSICYSLIYQHVQSVLIPFNRQKINLCWIKYYRQSGTLKQIWSKSGLATCASFIAWRMCIIWIIHGLLQPRFNISTRTFIIYNQSINKLKLNSASLHSFSFLLINTKFQHEYNFYGRIFSCLFLHMFIYLQAKNNILSPQNT